MEDVLIALSSFQASPHKLRPCEGVQREDTERQDTNFEQQVLSQSVVLIKLSSHLRLEQQTAQDFMVFKYRPSVGSWLMPRLVTGCHRSNESLKVSFESSGAFFELFLQGLVAFLGLSKTTKAVSKLRKFKASRDVGRRRERCFDRRDCAAYQR